MRLVTAVNRAAAAVAKAKTRGAMRPRAQGIVWQGSRAAVDPAMVGPEQHIAVDVDILDALGGGYSPETGAWVAPTLELAETERIADDPEDLGVVRLKGGPVVGRVVESVGQVLSIAYDAGVSPLDPPACGHCGGELGPEPLKHACKTKSV